MSKILNIKYCNTALKKKTYKTINENSLKNFLKRKITLELFIYYKINEELLLYVICFYEYLYLQNVKRCARFSTYK